jgi:hypothetical protein
MLDTFRRYPMKHELSTTGTIAGVVFYWIITHALLTGCMDDIVDIDDSDIDSSLCEDVICDDIPDDACEDGQLLDYTGEANCIEGDCIYDYIATDCEYEQGCYNETECWNPCSELDCTIIPDDECIGITTLHTYSEEGTCIIEGDEAFCMFSHESELCDTECIEVEDDDDYCI